MSVFSDVQEFVRLSKLAESFGALEGLLDPMARELGFDHFALMHHVDDPLKFNATHITNYPVQWVERITKNRYWRDDPVAEACRKSLAGFAWNDLNHILDLSERHIEILSAARECGLAAGYTVPANIPNDLSGSVSFGVRIGKTLPENALAATHYVGCFAYEAARRIARLATQRLHPLPQLTSRQHDCVILVARGKSDWEAAKILGLSKDTVHQHLQTAMKRFGVTTRVQLVVRTLFDGQLNFNDVVH